jgi:hypothetical protein
MQAQKSITQRTIGNIKAIFISLSPLASQNRYPGSCGMPHLAASPASL